MEADAALKQEVLSLVPQQPPFRFIDEIISLDDEQIIGAYRFREDEYFYRGHFPGNPIMPGVLLCEACFQTGAILMVASHQPGLGVVTRIRDIKFKHFARPGDTLTMKVTLDDQVDNAYYMSGTIHIGDKLILKIIFQAALLPPEQ